ncbi:MAG: hypothetical protein WAK34_00950 [Rhodoplanes sp.]
MEERTRSVVPAAVISMTTQKEQEREDARRLASFDEQDDGADDWHI